MKFNIHIYPSPINFETRILKVTNSLIKNNLVDKIIIIGKIGGKNSSIKEIDLNRKIYKVNNLINGRNFLIRSIGFLEWSIKVFHILLKEKVNIINCHSLSVLPLCFALKFWHNSILIYEPHELETETGNSKGLRKLSSKILERFFIKYVDHVFVVSRNISLWYQNKYKIKKPTVIFNSLPIFVKENKNYLKEKYNLKKNQKIIIYQGYLAEDRCLVQLIKAFEMRKNKSTVLVLLGYGEMSEFINAKSKQLKNVFYHNAVNFQEMKSITSSADIGIALNDNLSLSHKFCMPNKLFEYAMSGLPIIASNGIEVESFIKKHKIGLIIKESSPKSINIAIDRLLSKPIKEMGLIARKIAEQESWEKQEKKLIRDYKMIFKKYF